VTTKTTRPVHIDDYQVSAWLIDSVDLHIDLHDDFAVVRSSMMIRRNPDSVSDDRSITLDGVDMELLSVNIDGGELSAESYQLSDLDLQLKSLPDSCELQIVTRIEPQNNKTLSGLYKSGKMFCTQCESQGFRRISYYLDRPDIMARFTTTIEADKERYPVLLANGNFVAGEDCAKDRHRAQWVDPFPKPCYLFAMVAGNLASIEDSHTTASGREIKLQIFTEEHNIGKCDFAMSSLKKSMLWDERVYGLEYDLELFMIVAVDFFNMGAMENKGLNIFNSSMVLASPESTTDKIFSRIESVVAHEYFHNWTGNRVTCRDWFQLTLKEGLTVFRDQMFSEDMQSQAVERIDEVSILRELQFSEDAGPMAHSVQPDTYLAIDNFYTFTVYEKGAEIIRMLHTILGKEKYHLGIKEYFKRHDGQAVTTEDFISALEAGSGVTLKQFRRWYGSVGTPKLNIEECWNADKKSYKLKIIQSRPDFNKDAEFPELHIPLAIGLVGDLGEEIPVRLTSETEANSGTRLIELTEEREEFEFIGCDTKPHLSLLRGFSAPVIVEMDRDLESLSRLYSADSDSFARWDAGQQMFLRVLMNQLDEISGDTFNIDPSVVFSWGENLKNGKSDPSFAARALSLPGYDQICQHLSDINVDKVVNAISGFRVTIGQLFQSELLDMYHAMEKQEHDTGRLMDADSFGRRSLKNFCLELLVECRPAEYLKLAESQFNDSKIMTDTLSALAAIFNSGGESAAKFSDKFYQTWKNDSLVLNSWFRTHATTKSDSTLSNVIDLSTHSAFDIVNPNNVRALIGAFVMANPKCFHAEDGGGYRFLADKVREVDPLNPQMSASLVRGFLSWRKYETGRMSLMRNELVRLAKYKDLSPNAREIISRSLEVN
jgi:aminopeptidase N